MVHTQGKIGDTVVEIVEIGNHWFVAVRREKFDEIDERTILGAGETREKAIEQALIHSVDFCLRYEKAIDKIAKAIGASESYMDGIGQYVEVPGCSIETDLGTCKRIGSICFCEEDKEWGLFFR
jgi:hypothetical protein